MAKAFVYNRGTKHKPNWWIRFRDPDGKERSTATQAQTKAEAMVIAHEIKSRIAAGKFGIERPEETLRCGPLMEEWAASLSNRSAEDDRSRVRRYVLPCFAERTVKEVTVPIVIRWMDQLKAAGKLSASSQRHCLNLVSRFFSWAIERGLASVNPVRQIPMGKRPQPQQRRDVPWISDETIVRRLVHALPEPVGLLFYLGNRSGLRLGEIVGLRLSDLDGLTDGAVRVRFSYDGPLKEDKHGTGKVKWVPAAEDAAALLGPWLAKRRAAGAGPEDYVFPCANRGGSYYRKEYVEGCWERVARDLGLSLTWYQATRHSFVSRNLSAGASLDEVSAAVGHSSPLVTKRYYDHHIRKKFSPTLRQGLGLGLALPEAKILHLPR